MGIIAERSTGGTDITCSFMKGKCPACLSPVSIRMLLIDRMHTWHAISAHFAFIPQSIRLMVITAGKCTSLRCSVIGLSVRERLRNLTKHCSLLPTTQQNKIIAGIVIFYTMTDHRPHPVQLSYPHTPLKKKSYCANVNLGFYFFYFF